MSMTFHYQQLTSGTNHFDLGSRLACGQYEIVPDVQNVFYTGKVEVMEPT
jgi:hypothetical protein